MIDHFHIFREVIDEKQPEKYAMFYAPFPKEKRELSAAK